MFPIIQSFTDQDLYKFTMQRAVLECFPGTPVDYEFINRNLKNVFDENFAKRLRQEVNYMSDLKLEFNEYDFLSKECPFIGDPYLIWLKNYRYDPSEVSIEVQSGQLKLRIRGNWERAILWEVPLMSIISELYFENDPWTNAEATGWYIRQANEKGQILDDNGIIFTDFGTRRRRSWLSQYILVKELKKYKGFAGTSNVHLAREHKTKPLGTMAHEWVMGISALEGLRHANRYAMKYWSEVYNGDLGTVLPDTFGTGAFWGDFDGYYARLFDSIRHDSGDPFKFGDKAIEHYIKLGINPLHKTIIFSDGVTIHKAVKIQQYFKGRVGIAFGIGTHFTNFVWISDALNIVIKMINCDGIPVVKLSDEPGKAVGNRDALKVAKWTFFKEPL